MFHSLFSLSFFFIDYYIIKCLISRDNNSDNNNSTYIIYQIIDQRKKLILEKMYVFTTYTTPWYNSTEKCTQCTVMNRKN